MNSSELSDFEFTGGELIGGVRIDSTKNQFFFTDILFSLDSLIDLKEKGEITFNNYKNPDFQDLLLKVHPSVPSIITNDVYANNNTLRKQNLLDKYFKDLNKCILIGIKANIIRKIKLLAEESKKNSNNGISTPHHDSLKIKILRGLNTLA